MASNIKEQIAVISLGGGGLLWSLRLCGASSYEPPYLHQRLSPGTVASELLDLGKLHQTWSRLSKGAVKREIFHYYVMEREDEGSDEICF